MSVRLAVFASGGGSNLQALLDSFNLAGAEFNPPVRVVLVVSDRADAGALERAQRAGVESVVLALAGRPIDYVARETLAVLESADVDLIALAGYLRLVPPAVVRHFRERILNIHPALLPAFGGKGMFGLRVHRAVINAGCTVSGATVHLVDEQYDEGPILAQWPVPVLAGDTPQALAARVLEVEHMLYPAAIEALARARLSYLPTQTFAAPAPATFSWQASEAPHKCMIRRALGLE